jgi:hypothetical protein
MSRRSWRDYLPLRIGSRDALPIKFKVREVEGPPSPERTEVRHDLRGVRFRPETPDVLLEGVTAERVDFSDLQLWGFYAYGCEFIDCDFSGIRLEWLPFADGGSVFRRCRFHRAGIGSGFGGVRLEECDFEDADLRDWFALRADVVNCRFAGRVEQVVFFGCDPDEPGSRNEFRGNDFREADLEDVSFRFGIDLDAQRLPEGVEYVRLRSIDARIESARREIRMWENEAERAEAERVLDSMSSVFESETDVFTKREFILDWTDHRRVGEDLLALLERA